MSEFRFVIQYPDGGNMLLSEEDGLQSDSQEIIDKLRKQGFRHTEDRPMGENKLRVYRRDMPATDIVPPE